MAAGDVDRYIAELTNAIAEGRLQLDRDIYSNIQLPTYRNVTLPSSIAANTGMLPGDYVGGYGGRASAPFLDTNINMMGRIGGGPGGEIDPRLAALGYSAGDLTLAGQQQRTAEEQQRFQQDLLNRQFGATRSDADRAFLEAQRVQVQQQQAQDFQMSLEAGVPMMNGNPMPAWMQPHQEWARQYQQQNGGRPPGFVDLVQALAPSGRVPEDYNGGRPYPGQQQTVGPGIVFDPGHGGYLDTVTGKAITNPQELAATVQQRQGQASNLTMDANGQPIYTLRPGVGAQALGAQGDDPNARMGLASAAGKVQGGPALAYQGPPLAGLPAYQGPRAAGGLNFAGSGATAANYGGAPMSQAQRQLLEQGRATDIQAQLQTNAQRLQEEESLRQNAIAQGNLDLARQHEQNITGLQQQQIDLQKQNQEFQQGIAAGSLTGTYNGQATLDAQRLAEQQRQFNAEQTGTLNGQDTLAKGQLLGTFNGMSTLAGQQAYGGSALVGNGLTLDAQRAIGSVGGVKTVEAQQAENQTALGYLGLLANLRGPSDAFQALKVQNSTPGGLRDLVDAAAGRYQMGQFGGGDPNSVQAASLSSLTNPGAGLSSGPTQTTQGALPAYRGPASGQAVLSGQWSGQNIAKMTDYQKQVLLAQQEAMGQDPQAAWQSFQQSLPKYGGPSRARVMMG